MNINNELFLNLISKFWMNVYKEDSLFIEASLQAQAELIKSVYYTFLQREKPPNIKDFPIFKERFWDILNLFESDREYLDINLIKTSESNAYFTSYTLKGTPYAHIPYLQNRVYNSNFNLKGGDYKDVITRFTSGELNINLEYFNAYNTILTNNQQIVYPKTRFLASGTEFTVPAGEFGGVYKNRDYFIKRTPFFNSESEFSINSSIIFRKDRDPFIFKEFRQDITVSGEKFVKLFAPKVYLDTLELYDYFGAAVGIYAESSLEYKNFLDGILYLYTGGPSMTGLNVALNTAYGYPVAKENENIISVIIEDDKYVLKSDKNNTYQIRRKIVESVTLDNQNSITITKYAAPILKLNKQVTYHPVLRVNITNADYSSIIETPPVNEFDTYFPVNKFEGFLEDLQIVDYISKPRWWVDKISQSMLFRDLIDAPEDIRSDPETIDFLFENYLKWHTFGVFINPANLIYFSGIRDFFRILDDVKPTWTTYLISERPIEAFSGLKTEDSITSDDSAGVNSYFPAYSEFGGEFSLGMDMLGMLETWLDGVENPNVGVGLEDISSSYDLLRITFEIRAVFDDQWNPSPDTIHSEYSLNSRQVTVGFDGELGAIGSGDLLEYVTLTTGIVGDTDPIIDWQLGEGSGDMFQDTSPNNTPGIVGYLSGFEPVFDWWLGEGSGTTLEDSGNNNIDGGIV